MNSRLFALFALASLLFGNAAFVSAQTSYPMLMSLKPVAAQVGQASEHTVNSRYSMEGAYDVLVSGSGVTGEVVTPRVKPADAEKAAAEKADAEKANKDKKEDASKKNEKKADDKKKADLTKLQVRFTVAPDAELGVRDYRIVTPQGVSTVGQLVIARDPVVNESNKNDTLEDAQKVAIPATVCGAIEKVEDVDFFKFHVPAGTALSFHVRAARLEDAIHDLQNHCDPIIKLRNAAGVTLASNDNYFFADSLLNYKFEQEGEYVLEIRDVRYEGNVYWEYSIEINDRPFVENVYPLAVAAGQSTELQLVGFQLPPVATATCQPAADLPMGPQWVRLPMGSENTNPVPVMLSDLPLILESNTDNDARDHAQLVTIPVGINGRIEKEADVDCYAFEAKKGETFSFEVVARRRQSGLDSYIRILNEKGAQVGVNDDMKLGRRGNADSELENWSASADGKYFVEIRDVHLRGGATYPYFLKITRSSPYFTLFLDTDKTQLLPGGNNAIFCKVERKNGFAGTVQLHVDGLPKGVSATCGRILDGKSVDGMIVLEAAADAPQSAANIIITGTATHQLADGKELQLVARAQPFQETYFPGGGRGHWPIDSHAVAVIENGDIRSVKLSSHDITLKPGESQKIDINIERDADFKANVTLDMIYAHLSSVFGNSLPPGVTLDDKAAKSLLAGGATQGFLTLKAAKDAPPVERQLACVMANVSLNFVMKASYGSKPVFITVEKSDDPTPPPAATPEKKSKKK